MSLILYGSECKKFFWQITVWVVYSIRMIVAINSGVIPTIKTCLLSYATFNEYTILIYGKLILAKHKLVEISQIIKLASIWFSPI